MGGGRGRDIYLPLHCHHQNDSCIKMGSDESHFNVSIGSDGQSQDSVHKPQPFYTLRFLWTLSTMFTYKTLSDARAHAKG